MLHLAAFLIAYVAFVAQSTLAPMLVVGEVRPEFLVLAACAIMWMFDNAASIAWVGLLGFLDDCLLPGSLGIGMGTAVFIAFFCISPLRNAARQSTMSTITIAITATCAYPCLTTLIRTLATQHAMPASSLLTTALLNAAYTVALGIVSVTLIRLILVLPKLRVTTNH
jgi:rod shape-determining protein MreD